MVHENWQDIVSLQMREEIQSAKSCFKRITSMGEECKTKPQEQNSSI